MLTDAIGFAAEQHYRPPAVNTSTLEEEGREPD
jgi:hypothetical protein